MFECDSEGGQRVLNLLEEKIEREREKGGQGD